MCSGGGKGKGCCPKRASAPPGGAPSRGTQCLHSLGTVGSLPVGAGHWGTFWDCVRKQGGGKARIRAAGKETLGDGEGQEGKGRYLPAVPCTSVVCPVLSPIPFLTPPLVSVLAHMPVGGVQVQHPGWDKGLRGPCAQVTVAGGVGQLLGSGRAWLPEGSTPYTCAYIPQHMFTSTCRRGEQDEATGAVWVCTSAACVCLPPPQMVGYVCACWDPTFSLATGWMQGQRDPARLPQQGRQRLSGAAGRVLAPGRQVPRRGTLSFPEHRASDPTPAAALCHTSRWEQGAARTMSRVGCRTARAQGSSASRGRVAPTLPGQKH